MMHIFFITACGCMLPWMLSGQIRPAIYGIFEGRTPCREIASELELAASETSECTKRKLRLTLYHDSATHQPTTYEIRGLGEKSGEGKWRVLSGTPGNKNAIVYQLDMVGMHLFLLKADDNVLFILDRNRNFLVGNASFSYTLNRIVPGLTWDQWRDFIHKGYSMAEMKEHSRP